MNRSCFGAKLMDQPLMASLLADMCVESEAHALTAMRLARAFDEDKSGRLGGSSGSSGSEDEAAFFRMGVAIGKYWVTKRLPNFTYEAMEVTRKRYNISIIKAPEHSAYDYTRYSEATATPRISLWRASSGPPPSTPSGRAPATSCAWISSEPRPRPCPRS